MTFNVSQSKVKTYRRCRRAYHNRYVEKLRRKRISRPLVFGRIVHDMIEADLNKQDPFALLNKIAHTDKKMFAAQREEYGEIIQDLNLIMIDYFDEYKGELKPIKKNNKLAEHEFNIEIMPGVNWNGKIDLIASTPNRLRWLGEHKTFTRMPGDDERWRNLQSVTYIRAIDMMGWGSVDGVIWDYIRSKGPNIPQLLDSGKLSQNKKDVLPSSVKFAIKEARLKLSDYRDFIEKARHNRRDWFTRVFQPVKNEVVNRVFDDFLLTLQEMVDNHGKVKDMNIDRHCGWCDYEPLCRAELQGLDVDYVKTREYETEKSAEIQGRSRDKKKKKLGGLRSRRNR